MEQRLQGLENELAAISERLRQVEQRLDGLQGVRAAVPTVAADTELESMPQTDGLEQASLAGLVALLGRSLLIFGGAYLLRAITDMGWLPPSGGIVLGGVYALAWLLISGYVARTESQRTTALFYGIASVLMAMPLAIEASTRFAMLSGGQAAAAVALFVTLALAVAGWRRLRALSWLATLAGITTSLVLLRATYSASAFALVLLVIGIGSFWIVEARGWRGLQWFGASGADLGVALLALLVTADRWSIAPAFVGWFAILSLLIYAVSFAIRSHALRRPVRVFEVVQSVLAIGLAYWAMRSSVSLGAQSPASFGIIGLIAGLAAYALAFTPETRTTRGRNFFYYSTLGLVLVVGGSALMWEPPVPAMLWSVVAVLIAYFSGRYGRVSLSLQATLLLLAAAIGSGTLLAALRGLVGSASGTWPAPTVAHLTVTAATVLCLFIPVTQRSVRWGRLAGLPQLVALVLAVWQVGGLMVVVAAPLVTGVPGAEADLGALAALRTFILCASAVTLALSSRHRRWPEARWLAYPVLALTGIKLLVEDFPHGRPLTLFLALALVGVALIAVARLLHLEQPAAAGS